MAELFKLLKLNQGKSREETGEASSLCPEKPDSAGENSAELPQPLQHPQIANLQQWLDLNA